MSKHHTVGESFFMLMQDDLAAFLSDSSTISDTSAASDASVVVTPDWACESIPLEARQSLDAKMMPTRTNRATRIRQRQRLQAARDEVASLRHQLKAMHENHELRVF